MPARGASAPFVVPVSPGYFEAVGLRVLRGRGLGGDDTDGAPAEVVVNEALARLVWPGQEPVGRCLRFEKRDSPCYTVTGVVENSRWGYVIEPEPRPQVYVPLGNPPDGRTAGGVVIARATPGGARRVAGDLRAALAERFFGVSPGDPAVLLPVCLVLLAVAAAAALLPAWRGGRVDPMAALRSG